MNDSGIYITLNIINYTICMNKTMWTKYKKLKKVYRTGRSYLYILFFPIIDVDFQKNHSGHLKFLKSKLNLNLFEWPIDTH